MGTSKNTATHAAEWGLIDYEHLAKGFDCVHGSVGVRGFRADAAVPVFTG
jgi:hypothetical protein